MAEVASKQTIEEKLKKALEYKELGNNFYKEGNFKAAAGKYHRAILYMKVDFTCCKISRNTFLTLQAIDNDLHGTPAFLQTASVDPNNVKHIKKEVEQQCIQTNISGSLLCKNQYFFYHWKSKFGLSPSVS